MTPGEILDYAIAEAKKVEQKKGKRIYVSIDVLDFGVLVKAYYSPKGDSEFQRIIQRIDTVRTEVAECAIGRMFKVLEERLNGKDRPSKIFLMTT